MAVDNEIEQMRKEIRTDGYPMSIGEWASLYENKEIDIHPEFQRFYRWSDIQKANLIESILLGIPIPPIFVSQRKDGVWDVVDGLQRLSTIYQFLGILKDDKEKPVGPLILEKTKYLPSLEGKKWNDEKDLLNSLSSETKLLFKRSKIQASIILKESDEKAKYELFQRLNTGGSRLTEQEVRNCILVMINKGMYKWMKSMAEYGSFKNVTGLSDRLLEEQYDLELVLRFLALFDIPESELVKIRDLSTFLTERMVTIAEKADYDFKGKWGLFKKSFDLINEKMESDAFRRYNTSKGKFERSFSVSAFEVIAMGIAYNFEEIKLKKIKIEDKIKKLWENRAYLESSGMGVSASRRIPKLIPLGRKLFSL